MSETNLKNIRAKHKTALRKSSYYLMSVLLAQAEYYLML